MLLDHWLPTRGGVIIEHPVLVEAMKAVVISARITRRCTASPVIVSVRCVANRHIVWDPDVFPEIPTRMQVAVLLTSILRTPIHVSHVGVPSAQRNRRSDYFPVTSAKMGIVQDREVTRL